MTMTNGDRDTRDIARDTDLSDADARALAREACRAEPTLTGKEVGERFGRTARWGQKQATAARGERSGALRAVPAPAPTRNAGTNDAACPSVPANGQKRTPAARGKRQSGPLPWLALLLGLGASLAANVAAAEPTLVGRLVAAWPPVALALSVEMLLRQTRGDAQTSTAVRYVTAGAVTLVALVAAAASYSHMHALALEAGEGAMARLLPLSVDGLVVAATMTLLSGRRSGRH